MCSTRGFCGFAAVGFPIRKSSDQRLFTATRGLSQCPTSFFGTWCQGIHRKLLVASPRDAEKLILFGLHVFHVVIHVFISYYSVGKVQSHRLTGERCSQPEFRASITLRQAAPFRDFAGQSSSILLICKFSQDDPAHHRVVKSHAMKPCIELCYLAFEQILFTTFLCYSAGGDDGIRTRGLRLAKALLSH